MKQFKRISFLLVFLILMFATTSAYAEQLALKQGMSGDDVLKLQVKLQGAGFYRGSLDGNFGPGTLSAVTKFQADRGLEADGVAGLETMQALQSLGSLSSRGGSNSPGGALKQGMSGEDVALLQAKLQRLGYYQGSLDGNFGSGTSNAVINFQLDRGLEADGIAGLATLQALQSPASAPANRGSVGDRKAQIVVAFAKQFLGTPYVWAGASPKGFDCSGFTSYIFSKYGIDLPHAADGQFNAGVRENQPRLGDLVFFTTYEAGPSHVGIYIGNDQFIHASSGAGEVTITSLSTAYYSARYLGARRVLN